jgi:hypothetical protein
MKRLIFLLIITAAGIVVFLSTRGVVPLTSAFGPGLEPALSFFRSGPGLITVIAVPAALFLLLFGGEILRLANLLLLNVFAPVIDEEKRINRTLSRRIEASEKKLNATEQALQEFTTAVAEYAQHLSSHTSAIQGLSGASHELQGGSTIQSRFLEEITKNTRERLFSREALLAALKDNSPPEKSASETEKPAPKKPRPSYRALHPRPPAPPAAVEDKTAPAANKASLEPASLAEAMVLPYYRALDKLDTESPTLQVDRPSPKPEKSTAEAKKAVDSIMLPLYRTLYQAGPEKSNASPSHQAYPPGCARHRHPLQPW